MVFEVFIVFRLVQMVLQYYEEHTLSSVVARKLTDTNESAHGCNEEQASDPHDV